MNYLDGLLTTAAWELVFGGGDPSEWQRIIHDLIARGATFRG